MVLYTSPALTQRQPSLESDRVNRYHSMNGGRLCEAIRRCWAPHHIDAIPHWNCVNKGPVALQTFKQPVAVLSMAHASDAISLACDSRPALRHRVKKCSGNRRFAAQSITTCSCAYNARWSSHSRHLVLTNEKHKLLDLQNPFS